MEWILDFVLEIAQFLEEVSNFEDVWELRQTVSLADSFLFMLLNASAVYSGRILSVHDVFLPQIVLKFLICEWQAGEPFPHSFSSPVFFLPLDTSQSSLLVCPTAFFPESYYFYFLALILQYVSSLILDRFLKL